jgi:vesicle-associated membrane protein 7
MPILYSLVARDAVVLAEHASTTGNFAQIASQILSKIPAGDTAESRLSYAYDTYLFHHLKKGGLVFLCMAEESFGRRIPFLFLDDICSRFVGLYGSKAQTATAYGLNEFHSVLQQQMVREFMKPIYHASEMSK